MKSVSFTILALAASISLGAATDDWTQHNRYAGANQALVDTPLVVFMGNSITDHWDNIHPEFFTANHYANRGISGQVTSQMLARFQADVIQLHPQIVVILAGTNDIALNNGYIAIEHIAENIQSMCELAQHHHIQPIICSVLPAYEYAWRKEVESPATVIRQLNGLLQTYAEKNDIPYADYYSALADERGGLPEKYSKDGVHPTAAGYDIMEPIITAEINKHLKTETCSITPARTVYLYTDKKPNENGYTADDETAGQYGELYKTSEPRFDLYLPEGVENAPVILSCPGGGYRYISIGNEGINVAEYFVPRGYAVAVLKYRLPNGHTEVPLTDACRAMEILRDSADAWHIDKNKTGVIGFSAGGHLAATLCTKYTSAKARPDFGILVYPVISMDESITHKGSCRLLLGEQSSDTKRDMWSADKCVSDDTPPCFIVACQDDKTVPVENSIRMYQALTAHHVYTEMILLPTGGHGWGFARQFPQRKVFENALMQFLQGR
mgnify:FL=1